MKDVFTRIYQDNFWASDESVSGQGSTLAETKRLRQNLQDFIRYHRPQSILDIPCGDFNWMSEVDLSGIKYIGADVVENLIYKLRNRYHNQNLEFEVLDITKDKLPKVDMVLVRDLFGHFSNADVKLALKNLRASGSRYLLSTTFPNRENVRDIETGQWRPINLASMFGLPDPLVLIREGVTGEFSDKSLGLWSLKEEY